MFLNARGAHNISCPVGSDMSAANNADVLNDLPTLRDVPLGQLHQMAVAMRIDEKAMKEVLKERVELLARKAGFNPGFRTGACNGEHGSTVGVRPETAGVMYSYVSCVNRFFDAC